jgi:hypothetical protein
VPILRHNQQDWTSASPLAAVRRGDSPNELPPTTPAPILTLLAIVLVALVMAYCTAYCSLSDNFVGGEAGHCRCFRYGWQATLFQPAGWIESLLSGERCRVVSERN